MDAVVECEGLIEVGGEDVGPEGGGDEGGEGGAAVDVVPSHICVRLQRPAQLILNQPDWSR